MAWVTIPNDTGYSLGETYRQTFSVPSSVVPQNITVPKEFSFAGYGACITDWQYDPVSSKLIVTWHLVSPPASGISNINQNITPNPWAPIVDTGAGHVKMSQGYGTPEAFAVPIAGVIAALAILFGLWLVLDKTEKLTETVTASPTLNILLIIGAGFLALALYKQIKA